MTKITRFFRMQIVYHVPTQRIGEVLCDPFNPFVEREWLPVRAENPKAKMTHEDWRSADCEPLGYDWKNAWKRYNRLLEAKGLEQKMKVIGNIHNPKKSGDSGFDLTTPEAFELDPDSLRLIDTGIHVQLPAGSCGIIIGRSSLNSRGVLCVVGLIDAGYSGSIGVALHNIGDRFVQFEAGDRIGQLVICPFLNPPLERVESLDEFEQTDRAGQGFGSTGR